MIQLEQLYRACAVFLKHLLQSFFSILKVFLLSKFNTKLPERAGESIAILGNGPSLKISLEKFSDYFKKSTLFCVNTFASSPAYEQLKPQNYLLLDPAFADYDESKHDHPAIRKMFEDMEKKTSWKVNLFVPIRGKKSTHIAALLKRNANISVTYFNTTMVTGFPAVSYFLFRRNLGMARCTNVLCGCLFLSLNMGYRKIYLFGADHSWHEELRIADDNSVLIKNFHFDDSRDKVKEEKLYESIERKDSIKIHRVFWWAYKAFYDYIVIGEYAKDLNADVYNASEKSYIDAFKREKPVV